MNISKAFICINHIILLRKFIQYGIRGTALKWFTSCFKLRFKYLNISNMNYKRV